MPKIVIIGPSQISRNPRLVRNANALAAAGHNVHVITPIINQEQSVEDQKIIKNAKWSFKGVPISNKRNRINFKDRVIRKLSYLVSSHLGIAKLGSLSLVYGCKKLFREANIDADFYFAQQQSSLPVVAKLAIKYKKPFGCDIEDILAESKAEPKRLISSIEKKYLFSSSLTTTMSEAASNYLLTKYNLNLLPLVLYNTPSLDERRGEKRLFENNQYKKPSIYWFGQTLGPHSCALELLDANIAVGSPCKIFLRGIPIKSYVEKLKNVYAKTRKTCELNILPVISPDLMVKECMKYDILFGSQPSDELFHQLAIGNKVFTGLVAGAALLLENTIAHKLLNLQSTGSASMVFYKDKNAISKELINLSKNQAKLATMQQCSWELGTKKYNWEKESEKLVHSVEQLLFKR